MDTNRKKVKKISAARLRNVALWYLERFGGTRARVESTLQRRILEAEQEHGKEPEAEKWTKQVLDELESLGHINDLTFARSRIKRGLRQGKSRKHIEHDLRKSGISASNTHEAIDELQEGEEKSDLEAAQTYVDRHKLGHHREEPEAYENKDLSKLARRGFSYQTARRALNKN